jgi:hypothetical protein
MNVDKFGASLGPPLASIVFKVANEFFLLGVIELFR